MGVYGSRWSREETLLAFDIYCQLPFGKLHQNNAEIVELAIMLGRTPSSVAMKTVNFASLDPMQRERGIKGLSNASSTEQQIWDDFFNNSLAIVDEITAARDRLTADTNRPTDISQPSGPSDVESLVYVRRHQKFFRASVLSSYGARCALTGLDLPRLLVASHIVPWSASPERRCDPSNGLCLNALHDRAFDVGLITFDEDLRLVASSHLFRNCKLGLLHETLPLEGRTLTFPERFQPCDDAMRYHREHIFIP